MKTTDIIDAEVARLGGIAPAGHFLALRIRGSSPLMSFTAYPQAWTDHYMANGYVLRDPITTWAMTLGGTIRWSSRMLPDPFGVFRQAAAHGLRFGASVAHGPIGALTVLSMSRGDREFTDAEIAEAKAIVLRLHALTELPKALTEEERAILSVLAEGGGTAGVAARLEVSDATARARIRTLCDNLFAPTPADAVRRARDYKLT
jgi:LuxR family transcriptional regulator, quorum-sensing system regulator SdiA